MRQEAIDSGRARIRLLVAAAHPGYLPRDLRVSRS